MPQLSSDDVSKIKDVHRRWIAEEISGNSLGVLQFCTEDVMWMPPDAHVLRGKETITRWLTGPTVEITSLDAFNLEIHASGGIAYKSCDYRTSYLDAAEQKVRVMRGTHLWVMRRIEGDAWQVAVVAWSIWKDSGAA